MAPRSNYKLKMSRKEKRKQERKSKKQKRFNVQKGKNLSGIENKKLSFGMKMIKKSTFKEKKIKAVKSLKKLRKRSDVKKDDYGIPGLDEVMEIADQILTDKSHKEFIEAKREEVINRPEIGAGDRKKRKNEIFGDMNVKNTAARLG